MAIATGNTFVLKPSERDPSVSNFVAELYARGRPARRRLQRRPRRQGRRRRDPRPPADRGRLVRRLDADRQVHPRARVGQRQARAGAGRGQEPRRRDAGRRPRLRRQPPDRRGLRLCGPALHGDRRRRRGRRGRRPAGRAARRRRRARSRSDPASSPPRRWARSSRPRPATASRATSTGACRPARRRSSTAASCEVDGGNGFFVGPTLFDNVSTDMDIYTDEIFGPVLGVVRVGTLDEAIELINANQYANGTAIFTAQRPGRADVPAQGPGGHDRRQRADPGADGLLLLRRLEGRRCSATRTSTGPRACGSTRARRSSRRAGPRTRWTRRTTRATCTSRRRCEEQHEPADRRHRGRDDGQLALPDDRPRRQRRDAGRRVATRTARAPPRWPSELGGPRVHGTPSSWSRDPRSTRSSSPPPTRRTRTSCSPACAATSHVLCEKPLAPTAEASLAVVEAEAALGRRLVQVAFMRRYDAGYLAVKERLDAGAIGRPCSCTARTATRASRRLLHHGDALHELGDPRGRRHALVPRARDRGARRS